jgi:DNA polymerase-3 subunit delta
VPGWIQQRAKAKKIAVDTRAVQMLAAFVGANLRQLDNELDKLAAYASGRAVTTDDILLLVSDASEAIIWDLTDALSARNPTKAMRTLQVLRRNDDNPFGLLALIARQYRIILKVKEAMHSSGGQPAGNQYDIAKRVGEKPYPVQKAMQQARAYTFEELTDILDRLLEADFAMKTGADQSMVVDVLVAELTQKPQNASRTPVAHALS